MRIKKTNITLKKAIAGDADFLLDLRNQPDVFRYSRQNRPVSAKEHAEWFAAAISSQSGKNIFIVLNEGKPAGQIRFDLNGRDAEISISIKKEIRGKGAARQALAEIIKIIREEKKADTITAQIHKDNAASKKLFEGSGFLPRKTQEPWQEFHFNLKQ